MAKINGTLLILNVDGSPLAHVSNATLNTSRDLPEANDKDSAPWADHLDEGGLLNWSIDVDGNADWLDTANVEVLFDIISSRTAVDIVFGPEAAGYTNFTGKASTNDLTFEAPNEETATFSGVMTGKGELTKTVTS